MADKQTLNSIMSGIKGQLGGAQAAKPGKFQQASPGSTVYNVGNNNAGINQQLRPQPPKAPHPTTTDKPQQARPGPTGNKTQLRPSRPRPVVRPSRPGGPAVPPAPLKKMPRGMA